MHTHLRLDQIIYFKYFILVKSFQDSQKRKKKKSNIIIKKRGNTQETKQPANEQKYLMVKLSWDRIHYFSASCVSEESKLLWTSNHRKDFQIYSFFGFYVKCLLILLIDFKNIVLNLSSEKLGHDKGDSSLIQEISCKVAITNTNPEILTPYFHILCKNFPSKSLFSYSLYL